MYLTLLLYKLDTLQLKQKEFSAWDITGFFFLARPSPEYFLCVIFCMCFVLFMFSIIVNIEYMYIYIVV